MPFSRWLILGGPGLGEILDSFVDTEALISKRKMETLVRYTGLGRKVKCVNHHLKL